VTPRVSWKAHRGDPKGCGGTDYTGFRSEAYFADLDDISRRGDSALLEIPVTIVPSSHPAVPWVRRPLERVPRAHQAFNRLLPAVHWLRPNGRTREILVRMVQDGARAGRGYLQFMLHSSELMPGGSRRFSGKAHIEALYRDLEALFAVARETCVGATLQQYYDHLAVQRLQCV
ncbi:MAG: deacetylase, partial [bacterium]